MNNILPEKNWSTKLANALSEAVNIQNITASQGQKGKGAHRDTKPPLCIIFTRTKASLIS